MMDIDAILQLMRLCSIAQVRAELERLKKSSEWDDAETLRALQRTYENAFRQPK